MNPKEWPSIKFFGAYSSNDDQDLRSSAFAEFIKHHFHRELIKRREFYCDSLENATNVTFKSCKAGFNLLKE
jgi:hypothetical protein